MVHQEEGGYQPYRPGSTRSVYLAIYTSSSSLLAICTLFLLLPAVPALLTVRLSGRRREPGLKRRKEPGQRLLLGSFCQFCQF